MGWSNTAALVTSGRLSLAENYLVYSAIGRSLSWSIRCILFLHRSGSVVDSLAFHHTAVNYHRLAAAPWIWRPKARYMLPKRIFRENLQFRP